MNQRFLRIGKDSFYRQDSSGQLTVVTEPETLGGLKSGQLGFNAIENTRGLQFTDKAAGNIANETSQVSSTQGQQQGGDMNSMINQRIQETLTNFSDVSNLDQLEQKKQELLRKRLLAPAFSQGAGKELTPEARISAIRTRGQEFEPQIQALEGQISQLKRESDPIRKIAIIKGLLDIQEKMSPTSTSNKVSFNQAKSLRQEFIKSAGNFTLQRDAYSRIIASASNPSAAGDLALIFNYMKLLDPGSTVREGEFATAANSAGLPDRLRAQYNKVSTGERLASGQRNDFVDRSHKLYAATLKQHSQRISEYERLANSFGLDPRNVVVDLNIASLLNKGSVADTQTQPNTQNAPDTLTDEQAYQEYLNIIKQ